MRRVAAASRRLPAGYAIAGMLWRLTIVLLLIVALPISAQDYEGNECFEDQTDCGDGNSWESRHAWICGWYRSAYRDGIVDEIPDNYGGTGDRDREENEQQTVNEEEDFTPEPGGPSLTVC
ncbi:MAG: hypothetical protein OXP68_04325 [Anaerolineaceae bacterium]|nr:hypothetical protein [Anaerolineaceae bacterium]MDE0327840.1 hypothetical protein [Anaerolineaceae bacterium]